MRLVWFRGGWYAYERLHGQPKRTSLRTKDREVAARQLADLERGRRAQPQTITEMHALYVKEHVPHIRSQETLRLAWGRLLPIFGHLRPDQIDRARTRAYAARERRRGIGDASIRRDLGVLGAIVRYTDPRSPAIIEMPAAPSPRARYLTREEYLAFREASKPVWHFFVFATLAYSTAGREDAILELQWRQIDFGRRMISLKAVTQDGAGRMKGRAVVPMTEACYVTLQEARRVSITDYVVEYAGRRVASVKRAFKAALGRAGLDTDLSSVRNLLRHSAAVHMVEGGASMEEVGQFLGHTDVRTTYRVYARFSPNYLRKAARALE